MLLSNPFTEGLAQEVYALDTVSECLSAGLVDRVLETLAKYDRRYGGFVLNDFDALERVRRKLDSGDWTLANDPTGANARALSELIFDVL